MNMCRILSNLLIVASAFAQTLGTRSNGPLPRVERTTIDGQKVTVLRVKPGYVSSVRLPEEVSSVVLGDPKNFRAEHSEAEPRLVFFKALGTKPCETNALITTKSGHEVSLSLISGSGTSGPDEVDFFIDYEPPHSFVIQPASNGFLIGENRSLNTGPPMPEPPDDDDGALRAALIWQSAVSAPQFVGNRLQVAVGAVSGSSQKMVVSFSVYNNSDTTIELLPPQVQLATKRKTNATKAEQIPVQDYAITRRRLPSGARADGVVIFERPSFKESNEELLLQVAQAAQVDHPVLTPIVFTPSPHREAQ